MADKTVKFGAVTVSVPERLMPPEDAGSLSAADLARIPKAPRSVGALCESAADGIERVLVLAGLADADLDHVVLVEGRRRVHVFRLAAPANLQA